MSKQQASTALITGTSSGIGLEAAIALAQAGFAVVATMRDLQRATTLRQRAQAAKVQLDIRKLDITDAHEAEHCVAEVVRDYGAIDLLVNNAGSGFVGSLEQISMEDLEKVMDVDFMGTARLTRLVLPGQRERRSGRILSVTSVGGIVGQPFNDSYCAAKFAVEGLMESLAPVAKSFGVHVAVIEPGAVATEFIANAAPSIERQGDDPYQELWQSYIARTQASFSAAQTPAGVAEVIVLAATEEQPRFRYQTSATAQAFVGQKLSDLDGSKVQNMTSQWIKS
ncbi:SDR family oxidoreductase [Tengunoibacter tsumagoiensis]|uniref:Short-chain dehydrogenase/reductase n=1 Tax=Tengunoibacter tsumagoiensis TaxID=2014871 RepID=A0A402A2X0_9CHLR|nr:SDR family oxidoreductase [Tengunoibacter tsumagoiensis]GCE13493.1 short-chain dehydrogenase/reductase [Tengunoibacter tsumagoiensis]